MFDVDLGSEWDIVVSAWIKKNSLYQVNVYDLQSIVKSMCKSIKYKNLNCKKKCTGLMGNQSHSFYEFMM